MVEFVAAYDTRTGRKLPRPVPKPWIGSARRPHLAETPSGQPQGRPVRHPPVSAPDLGLTPDAEPMTGDDAPELGEETPAATPAPTTLPPEEHLDA